MLQHTLQLLQEEAQNAGLQLSAPKCKLLRVTGRKPQISKTTEMDVKALRHRCDVCDMSFDTQQGLQIHKTRWCTGREEPIRSRKGTQADKLVRRDKRKAIEENRNDKLFLKDGSEVKGTFANAYLGVQLTVEGTSDYEVKCRIRKAEAARNEICSFLCDSHLPLALRVQLLRVQVFSVLLYSAESWDLSDDSLCRTLKHFGRRCMATLLKKSSSSVLRSAPWLIQFRLHVNCNGTGKAM